MWQRHPTPSRAAIERPVDLWLGWLVGRERGDRVGQEYPSQLVSAPNSCSPVIGSLIMTPRRIRRRAVGSNPTINKRRHATAQVKGSGTRSHDSPWSESLSWWCDGQAHRRAPLPTPQPLAFNEATAGRLLGAGRNGSHVVAAQTPVPRW